MMSLCSLVLVLNTDLQAGICFGQESFVEDFSDLIHEPLPEGQYRGQLCVHWTAQSSREQPGH